MLLIGDGVEVLLVFNNAVLSVDVNIVGVIEDGEEDEVLDEEEEDEDELDGMDLVFKFLALLLLNE